MKKFIYLIAVLFFALTINAAGQCGKVLVLNSNPWGQLSDQTAMNTVFGAGNWSQVNYATSPATIFSATNCFVMLEGSELNNPTALKNFLTANITLIENWVANGGRLFINAAPNEGGNISCGFNGTVINYNTGPYCGSAAAVNTAEAVFQGPFTPVSTTYTGGYFSHASVTGSGLTNLLTGNNPAPAGTVILAYKKWGIGVVFFGGLTQPAFWNPQPQGPNLWYNIYSYVNIVPTFSISCNVNNNSFCSFQATPVTVSYTAVGTYNGANIFTAQLSNASGSFAAPVNIGNVTAVTSGTINATIPAGTAGGSGYRVRVVASAPSVNGSNNGTNIQINAALAPSVSIVTDHPDPICSGTSVIFTATPLNGGIAPSYQWKKNGNNVGTNSNIYTDATLINGDVVNCVLTSNAACISAATAQSNSVSTSVNSITSSTTTVEVCSNDLPYIWNNISYNNSGSYSLIFTNAAGCDSVATLNLTLKTSPVASIINNTGTTVLNCTIAAVSVTANGGATYSWNNGLGSGASKTITSPGTYTVTASSAQGCTSQAAISLTQNLAVPEVPETINGLTNVCPYVGTATQLTYSVNQDPVALSYQWIVPPTVNLVSGQGTNSINITIGAGFTANANKLFRVKAISDCGSSADKIFYLVAQLPGTPQPITASATNVCEILNTANSITYTISKVTAATSYLWTAQSGSTVITHPNGPGENDTTVLITFGSGFSSSNISVRAVNDCGTSNARSLLISRSNPSTPGLISGPINVCANIAPGGIAATYSIATVANATSYTWNLPPGSISITGQGTTSVSFIYPTGFTSGSISVTATNGCGTSATRLLAVTRLNPSTPGVIDVIQQQACSNRIYSYTIATMPANASSVQWTVPTTSGAQIISGQGTTSILVSYPSTAINGFVTATAQNNCGVSVTRQSIVKLPFCAPEFVTKGIEPPSLKITASGSETAFSVSVFPNPSVNEFRLMISSASREKIVVKLYNIQGSLLKEIKVNANEVTVIGNELAPGTYLLDIGQGSFRSIKKLLKF